MRSAALMTVLSNPRVSAAVSSDSFACRVAEIAIALDCALDEASNADAERQLNKLAWLLCARSGGGACRAGARAPAMVQGVAYRRTAARGCDDASRTDSRCRQRQLTAAGAERMERFRLGRRPPTTSHSAKLTSRPSARSACRTKTMFVPVPILVPMPPMLPDTRAPWATQSRSCNITVSTRS